MVHNYNTLTNAIEQFANAHKVIKRFKISFLEQFGNFSTADNLFPILFAIPTDVVMLNYVDHFSLRMYCVDILQKDRSNEKTIINNTQLVLRDFKNWIELEESHGLSVINNPVAVPVNNYLMEDAVGWYMDMTIELAPMTSDCAIPFQTDFQYSATTCDGSIVNRISYTVFNSDNTFRTGITNDYQLLDITHYDSDGEPVELPGQVSFTATTCSTNIFNKYHWTSGDTTTDLATTDIDSAGLFTSISDDGGSGGGITLSVNLSAYSGFTAYNPLTLASGDTISFIRTGSTNSGWVKLTGTF